MHSGREVTRMKKRNDFRSFKKMKVERFLSFKKVTFYYILS